MINKYKRIHTAIVIILALLCLFIGFFEDAFVLGMVIIASAYNLMHVLFLRKYSNEKFFESVFYIIYIWALILSILLIGYAAYIFVFGYLSTSWFGSGGGNMYYGIDAWLNNLLVVVTWPVILINIIYILVYLKLKNRKTVPVEVSDTPQPFGYKTAWLAIKDVRRRK